MIQDWFDRCHEGDGCIGTHAEGLHHMQMRRQREQAVIDAARAWEAMFGRLFDSHETVPETTALIDAVRALDGET